MRGYLRQNLNLVELGEELALMNVGVDVDEELGDDAAGLGFDLDLRDGLDLAGGDDGAGDVSALNFGKLRGVKFGAAAPGGDRDACDHRNEQNNNAAPYPEFAFILARCRHVVAPRDAG